jgi:uncharacterized protein (DUF2132 family)
LKTARTEWPRLAGEYNRRPRFERIPAENPRSEASMADTPSTDPLHGVTLEAILLKLVNKYGWDGLAKRIDVKCFKSDPSINSSLKFLRKTPWARKQVEDLYVSSRFWTRDS